MVLEFQVKFSFSFSLNTGLTKGTDLFWLNRSTFEGSRYLSPPDHNSNNPLVSWMIKNKQPENTLFCKTQHLYGLGQPVCTEVETNNKCLENTIKQKKRKKITYFRIIVYFTCLCRNWSLSILTGSAHSTKPW